MKHFAHLKESSPFFNIFPQGVVPIQNTGLPEIGIMEDDNHNLPQAYYRVDLGQLSEWYLNQLCEMVASLRHGTAAEVRRDILQDGFIPLRASQVRCITNFSIMGKTICFQVNEHTTGQS